MIVASWFISPLMSGIMAYVLYMILRLAVLRGAASYKKAIWCLPILLFVTLFVNMFFILYKVTASSACHTSQNMLKQPESKLLLTTALQVLAKCCFRHITGNYAVVDRSHTAHCRNACDVAESGSSDHIYASSLQDSISTQHWEWISHSTVANHPNACALD